MKKMKLLISLFLASLAMGALASCDMKDKYLKDDSESVTSEAPATSETPEADWSSYPTITIEQALLICGEPGNITEDRFYIRAFVTSITNPQYGSMTIQDATGSISVYGTWSEDGEIGYADFAEKPYKGDEVLLHCILQNYNGTKEIKNARLIDFKSNQGNVDESAYMEMSIAEAREEAEGALVKVDGVVASITYANGMKPSGVYLVDETSSIYVYDGDLAGRVSVGNTVTILAEKDWWILDSEQESADKHGYKGCNQLANVTLVSSDEGNSDFDKSWIQESTVKEIVEHSVADDITTQIYKVNALVKEAPGNGFTNFYFFDLDGETGNYVYTQCNGNDFTWLREFEGKICTVYLAAHNAKSSATASFYRLMPIAVVDEGYQFDTANAPEFVMDYYALDQFDGEVVDGKLTKVYTGDPALSVVTSVSSELLKFENATISYESQNTSIVDFVEEDGALVMHCKAYGKTDVVITVSHNGAEYQSTIAIEYEVPADMAASTVAEAIAAAPDTDVTVKGIVGPSVVNKNGFYLFGEDGSVISVLVNDTNQFTDLEIGHEVILKGMRERYVKDDASAFAGQTCIVNAEILVNYYGQHEYSTEKFVEATGAEFYALDKAVDYSTSVFVISGTVEVVSNAYYTNMNLVAADGTTVGLYMSGAGQYAWLQAFAGQQITMEVAACNWNDKNYWRGCVIAVRLEDGTKVFNTLNFDTY